MDLEIQESEKNAEEVEVMVEKNGQETTKKIKASFKTASQLPRHTRSNKVFDHLYDDDHPLCLAQFGAGWVDQTNKNCQAWFFTHDGPRINVLGLYESYTAAAKKGFRIVKLTEKHGYKSYGMCTYPSRNWIVLRRFHPIHVKDDEVLATNILNYAKRWDRLTEIDFGEEIRQKDRPLVKPPEKPKTLSTMHPKALKDLKSKTRALRTRVTTALERLKQDKSLTRKQFLKAKSKLKKMQRTKLKGLVSHIPTKSRDPKQNYAAVAWQISPRYAHVDKTKYFGYSAPDVEEGKESDDPAPDKVFTKEDFDEAMLVCILRTFKTEEECLEFIDNKAKHDLAPSRVVCVEMYENTPMDFVLTEEFEKKVKRGYLTDLQQKVIVEREDRTKANLKQAKENPDFVQEIVQNEDGTVTTTESNATKHIRNAIEESRAEAVAEMEANRIEHEEGGASKEEEEEVPVQEEEEGGASKEEEHVQEEEEGGASEKDV